MTVIRARDTEKDTEDVPTDEMLYVFTVTDGGFAKKTTIDQYRLQGRGGIGIKAMQITEKRGVLVGGLVLNDTDDVISVTEGGQITRSLVAGVPAKGRGTMGVSFVKFKGDDRVVTIARNAELPTDETTRTTERARSDETGRADPARRGAGPVSKPDDQIPRSRDVAHAASVRTARPEGGPAEEGRRTRVGPPKGKPHVVDPIEQPSTAAPPKSSRPDDGRHPGQSRTSRESARPQTPSARPQRTPAPAAQPGRRASLRLVHVEPWSVTRLAFVVSVAMMIVAVVAVSIFWLVLSVTGVWGQINDSVTSVLSDDGGTFDIKDYLGFGRLFGLTLVLSAINVVLMTALATIGAHLYNLAAQLLGGLEVTFSDD